MVSDGLLVKAYKEYLIPLINIKEKHSKAHNQKQPVSPSSTKHMQTTKQPLSSHSIVLDFQGES